MGSTVKWGILAAGVIAEEFATALQKTELGDLRAVAARDFNRAAEFAKRHGAPHAYGSYEELLADPEVEAVYIATLHPLHLEWIVKSVQAGKHVLCEKPITMNAHEAKLAKQQADEHRCLLREAFMYRHHPQTQRVVDLVTSGIIGQVRMIETSFCYNSGVQPESRVQAKELGGGAILDVGCYGLSFSRLIAGRANDRLFSEPIEMKAVGHLDPQLQTDMWTTAVMRFEGDIMAKVSAAVRVETSRQSIVYGDTGRIIVEDPWHCRGGISVVRSEEEVLQSWPADTSRPLFTYEIESFARELRGQPLDATEVAMRYDDTLGNMKALDRWRAEIGLRYEADQAG